MKQVEERNIWKKLEDKREPEGPHPLTVELSRSSTLEISRRCHIISGLNGSGKSEVLDRIADAASGYPCVTIRLHSICEQVLEVLRSRDDIEDMEEEVGAVDANLDLVATLNRVIGRDYESVEWFSLDLESTDLHSEAWPWAVDLSEDAPDAVVPHFRVTQDGISYASHEMGLGEFSVHLLLWVMYQFRTVPGTVFLLDEPDAYLPPTACERLISAVQSMAFSYRWYLIITSHTEGIIRQALQHEALVRLHRYRGEIVASIPSYSDRIAVRDLLRPVAIDTVVFCEDEVGTALARALVRDARPDIFLRIEFIWKNGHGYLQALARALPRTRASSVRFCLLFDGDQEDNVRANFEPSDSTWPSICLPGGSSPDALLRTTRFDPSRLANVLNVPEDSIYRELNNLQGYEDHDWVNEMADRFGPRTAALDGLARIWIERNPSLASEFATRFFQSLVGGDSV